MTPQPTGPERWAALGFAPPASDLPEPDQPVVVDYVHDGRVAIITLNRPAADNAITTEMGALLTEIFETIAVRTEVRVAILTGAGDRAFSVGSDLRQRKTMTKEDWLRQRQNFDRTLYTVRQLRKPIFAAVNGLAYGGGSELAQSTDFMIASENATFGQPEAMIGLAAGGGSPASAAAAPAARKSNADAPDRRSDHRPRGSPARDGQRDPPPAPPSWTQPVQIAEKIAGNSPTAVQAVKWSARTGQGEPLEQAISIMMAAHWRSAVHPDRVEGIGAFNEGREPIFQDPDY